MGSENPRSVDGWLKWSAKVKDWNASGKSNFGFAEETSARTRVNNGFQECSR